ncbi:MAG: hypothetical protein N3G20_02880 [Verrucomicrobiae bacterium]|nr:hypothetical protein [Verrucomicrobiae bacterium]
MAELAPMKVPIPRRSFIRKSLTATAIGAVGLGLEERALILGRCRAEETGRSSQPQKSPNTIPTGKICKVEISRVLCGGNLISGYAHSRDLIYVSTLLKHYFTDEKVMETWARCEQEGINTMVAYPGDPHAVDVYRRYRERGGKIQYLAQLNPAKDDLVTSVKQAAAVGAVGAFLLGNLGDLWTREGNLSLIRELIKIIKDHGLIAGVAGHENRTIKAIEDAGIEPDFYVKTLHSTNYWSARRPDQHKEVIDNYAIDNYWCRDPQETINMMSEISRPWIAYKVLAAGAIHPRAGFRFAFENGADFILVGMFDFQIAEDAAIARQILAEKLDRHRDWMA